MDNTWLILCDTKNISYYLVFESLMGDKWNMTIFTIIGTIKCKNRGETFRKYNKFVSNHRKIILRQKKLERLREI